MQTPKYKGRLGVYQSKRSSLLVTPWLSMVHAGSQEAQMRTQEQHHKRNKQGGGERRLRSTEDITAESCLQLTHSAMHL